MIADREFVKEIAEVDEPFYNDILNYYSILAGTKMGMKIDTPKRVYNFAQELQAKRAYDKFSMFLAEGDQMIVGNHLRVFSFCEHHLLPFFGEASIAYIPDKEIFGLSKFQRVVDKFASTPQVQERLTTQIIDFIQERLCPRGVAVQLKCIHTCVFARGVNTQGAEFTTTAVRGVMKDNPQAREEFLSSIADSRLRI
jgi:GTP cyclohydrolase I